MTENLSLKEELKRRKSVEQAQALQEAKQLLESYYLIAEKLDTGTISKIVDAMNSVEEALGPLLGKLPSLQRGLDAAEAELTNLISGKGGNDPKKTGAMMGKAMAFYQHLSSFLRQDLPVLLKSRVMAGAKAQADQPVGPKIAPAFQQALQVEKTGGFLKKLFGDSNIPYVDNARLAQELSTLSFKELEQLSKVGQTPAVMPQAQIDQAAQAAVGQGAQASAPVAPASSPAAPTAPGAPASGGVSPDKLKNVEEFLRSTISGLMQGSPAAAQVAAQTAKKIADILK
jgi:hypothetical protein